MNRGLDGLFYPYTICLDETTLKYLLLLYDRILFLPIDNKLNPGHHSLSLRWSAYDGVLLGGFGERDQLHRAFMYGSEPSAWDNQMAHLMAAYDKLEASGICVPLRDDRFEDASSWHPLADAVERDLADAHFMYRGRQLLNKSVPLPEMISTQQMKGRGVMLRPPRRPRQGPITFLEITSQRLNTALAFAAAENVVPVSTHMAFVALLNAKLRREIESRDLRLGVPRFTKKQRARFSMLSLQVMSEVATPEAISRRTFDEILAYRAESSDARLRFLALLSEIQADLNEEPWSDDLRDEIGRNIQTRVLPAMQAIRDAKSATWQTLFHESLTAILSPEHVAKVATVMTGLHLFVAPLSYVDLLGYGTAGALSGLLPGLLRARQAETHIRHHALFYILNLR